MVYYLVALAVFLIDRITKVLIVRNLQPGEQHAVWGSFFAITSLRNRGAAFSILQNQRLFFILITVAVAAGIIWYLNVLRKTNRHLLPFALGLILGGACGNFYDRALRGEVVDFLQFHFRFSLFGHAVDYIFPIFNLADSAIVLGVALIFLDALFARGRDKRRLTNEQV